MSDDAQCATVLKNLNSSSLISLGQICDDKCSVVMDSKQLFAIKTKDLKIDMDTNNILMQGYRNPTDGLYDIPITNATINSAPIQTDHYFIQPDNFVFPEVKGYTVQQHKKIKFPQCLSNNKKIFQTKETKNNVNIMTLRKFNNILTQILNNTRSLYQPVNINASGKLNVIIRKNETKHDLITFLYGAMCSPVPSTWIQAIKNIHFFYGQD